ncbi:MAG: fused MFS/spermidine synthase [Candidatus Omnitrophica bacterium]|nr:fused MFS/spermidine synthase [Candidatus Omnitrophota bacterium]
MPLFFIHAVIFICGSVLMSLEIAASRLLAPFFGSTIFVWASLISVLLTALACGYFLGGILADRRPSITLWGALIGLAGIAVLFIPLLSGPVCRFIAGCHIGVRSGSLLTASVLFFLPGLLLGMICPFAVKFSLKKISAAGNVAGRIYAVSTAGNIFGTLFTAFYLIAALGVLAIFTALGMILIITAITVILSQKKRTGYLQALALGAASLCLSASPAPALVLTGENETLLLEQDSFYHHVMVIEDSKKRIRRLRFDSNDQTAVYLDGSHESAVRYTTMLHLPLAFVPRPGNALFIGAGGGVVPRNYSYDYPGIDIDVVEIDPLVARVSRDYFFFKPGERLRLIVADGRRFVRETDKLYDIVVHDAYFEKGHIPFHLLTREFFEELCAKMTPQGVLALNLGGSVEGKNSALFLSVCKTLQSVFNRVYVFPDTSRAMMKDYSRFRNLIFIAVKSGPALNARQLYTRMAALVRAGRVKIPAFAGYARTLLEISPRRLRQAPLLSDDYAPVGHLMER